MIEHLQAADNVAKTCNFKLSTAEIQVAEQVALPHDDRILTDHSHKHGAPVEKGCEPSLKKTATTSSATTTTATTTTAATATATVTSSTVTATTTAPSQVTTRSKTAVAVSTASTTGSTSTGTTLPLPHRKSIHLPAKRCVCGKVFETKHYLNLHIGRKHKENYSCLGKVVEKGKEYDCSFVSTDRNSMWMHFRTIHLNIWCNYCVVPMCDFG